MPRWLQRRAPRLLRVLGDCSGDTIIEMAIALPTMLTLLFGICAFALMLTGWCSATYAIRVGARYAGLHSSTSAAPATSTAVTNLVNSQLFMPGAVGTSVTVNYYQYTASNGNYVGNVVGVAIAWNQSIKVPYYNKTVALQSVQYRIITR